MEMKPILFMVYKNWNKIISCNSANKYSQLYIQNIITFDWKSFAWIDADIGQNS